jgi:hypothetical protein
MVDILHMVGVKSPSTDRVYKALSTIDGLASWWTTDTRGESKIGGRVRFNFEKGSFDMKVLELEPPKRVLWEVVDGPSEWVGTKISFDLQQDGDYAVVMFKHQGWREPSGFMHHCSTKWASFLFSLKALVEKGQGAPHPQDVRVISDDQ